MEVANLPEKTEQSTELTPQERFQEAIADKIAAGMRPPEIARRAYPKDKQKQKVLRQRIWRMVRKDAQFHRKLAERAAGELAMGLVPATAGLSRRAARGRVDAAKVVLETTGFHNPKVQHEHSGEIKVTLDIPRPAPEVVDAEVVE